ncbi:uncharacterized protein TRIVIDRAFT_220813 [Trichoderma virens Gv29-8]|uniref:Uncharacterized protein n=1 Tax=Hypocrea virens (strain Gv29-8 / FGSC 10586) TaxID=413071 RepID=G9MNV0_HYPVG|nr:uncharacterized protein TRIVIDRAFT_220813 [Trichoderma virens Gv29-8]EHK23553.1 hypothetical protein TRIVIDRAFT_220813 [Trichoderma virens Gv29-8]UKZ49849.1 hypothetical protein TrVGV298_004102 [Trichoderma virens]
MTGNANYSHEIYYFAIYVHRILAVLCWLCQQLQQLTAHVIQRMDEERERGNRGEADMKIDRDDNDLDDVDMDDIEMDDAFFD